MVLPWWLSGQESTCQYRRLGFDLWVGRTPWRRKQQPTLVFLPGESQGQRSLMGYSPWIQRFRHNLATKTTHTIWKASVLLMTWLVCKAGKIWPSHCDIQDPGEARQEPKVMPCDSEDGLQVWFWILLRVSGKFSDMGNPISSLGNSDTPPKT